MIEKTRWVRFFFRTPAGFLPPVCVKAFDQIAAELDDLEQRGVLCVMRIRIYTTVRSPVNVVISPVGPFRSYKAYVKNITALTR